MDDVHPVNTMALIVEMADPTDIRLSFISVGAQPAMEK